MMSTAKKTKHRLITLTQLAILTAIIVVMAFTPLGYLRMPGLEITFITIPVVVGAIVMGPGAGAALGAIFGLTSFFQCFGMSPFGAALLGINPVLTFIVCFVPRTLMGLLTGWIFKAFRKKNFVAFGVSSLSGALLNTILFMTALILLFGGTDYIQEMQAGANVFAFVIAFVGINGLVEAIVCFILGAAISKAVYVFNQKRL